MFINIDDVLNGESLQSQLNNSVAYFEELIYKNEEKLNRITSKVATSKEKKISEACKKKVEDLTIEDKHLIYDEYKIINKKMNEIYSLVGGQKELLPDFDKISDEMWQIYQTFVSIEFTPQSSQIKNIQSEIDELVNQRDNIAYVQVSKERFFAETQKVEDICNQLLESGRKPRIVIYENMAERSNSTTANYVYTKEEFNKLIDFNNRLRFNGMQDNIKINELSTVVTPSDFKRSWDLQTVVEANNSIDNIVNFIKSKNFTPYEAMLYIHRYITSNFAYKHGDYMSENVIMGSFTDKSIICSGYSSLTKAIIDKLNYPELKCDMVSCKIYRDDLLPKFMGTHSQCLIHIKDKEYGIDGTYINDTCWDSKISTHPKGRGFANCLIPLEDSQHFRNTLYVQLNENSRYDAIIINLQELAKCFRSADKLGDYIDRISLKLKTPVPNFTKKYGNKSEPIPYSVFEKGLHNMVHKIAKEDQYEKAEELIKRMKEDTLFFAKASFNKNASNCFIKHVNKNKIKFDKKAQQKAQQNQNNPIVKE